MSQGSLAAWKTSAVTFKAIAVCEPISPAAAKLAIIIPDFSRVENFMQSPCCVEAVNPVDQEHPNDMKYFRNSNEADKNVSGYLPSIEVSI
jgi:hypothetical protein